MNIIEKVVRKKLQEYLEQNKISIYAFAKKSNMHESTIRNILNKEDYNIGEENILKISRGMDQHPYEIFCPENADQDIIKPTEKLLVEKVRKLHRDDLLRLEGYIDCSLQMSKD